MRPIKNGGITESKDIVEVDPIFDYSCCVLKTFEVMPMNALLLEYPNDAFDHSVLLRTVRGYGLLFEVIASDEAGEIANFKNQAIFRTQKEGVLNFPD